MKPIYGALAVLCLSSAVFAQDVPPPPPSSPPPPPGAYVAPADPSLAPVMMSDAFVPHFRWGIDGSLGWFFPANALDFGAAVRLGAQVTPMIGVYADLGYDLGIGFSASANGSASVSGVGFWHITPMVEADFGNFFVGAGPFLGSGGWGQVSQTVAANGDTSQSVIAAGGFMPGAEVRTGFIFGPTWPGQKRGGFLLALDVKAINAAVVSVSQSTSSGGSVSQGVQTGDRIWGVTPMLTLGYEMH